MTLMSISDLAEPRQSLLGDLWRGPLEYTVLADQRPEGPRPQMIVPPELGGDTVQRWLRSPTSPGFEWRCLLSNDLIVAGIGNLKLGSDYITDPTMVPSYWLRQYESNHYYTELSALDALPMRTIDAPTISVIGWGHEVYGHFLIEALPRLLAVRAARGDDWAQTQLLLRSDTPAWFAQICRDYLGLTAENIVNFDPAKERIRLKRAIVPAQANQLGAFHPAIRDLVQSIQFSADDGLETSEKLFISRENLPEARRKVRNCVNEPELCRIAEEFGYRIYAPEAEGWDRQIRRFRTARAVVGLAGSGLHSSLLVGPDLIVGSVGLHGQAQLHLASLTGQRFAVLGKGVEMSSRTYVDPEDFRILLASIETELQRSRH